MAHNWIHMTPDSPIPQSAVIGEIDSDGSPNYIGRSSHEGGTFPARVVSKEHCAYVSWGGSQIKKTDYEILVGGNYRFVKYSADAIPVSAVRAGNTFAGEPLWVGRGTLDGKKLVGKIHPIHQCLFVAFGGEEHRLDSKEILIRDPSYEENEVLVGDSPQIPIPERLKSDNVLPPNGVVPGDVNNEVPVDKQLHTWVRSDWGKAPPDAVVAGKDSDGSMIYVGRAYHEGETLPAKVIPQKSLCYVSCDGRDVFKIEFEVLVGDGYKWVEGKHSGDNIPIGAVSTGQTRDGKPVYVGRGPHVGSLTPGKVHPGDYNVYIPFYTKEHKISDYEILVKTK